MMDKYSVFNKKESLAYRLAWYFAFSFGERQLKIMSSINHSQGVDLTKGKYTIIFYCLGTDTIQN